MYNRVFWLAYAANTMLMVCVSILFRYADFVTFRGGSELTLGAIVGVGMVGALAMRGVLGTATDRYGSRRVWIASLLLVIVSLAMHWAITPLSGPLSDAAVYLARIVWMVGLAGAFGASLTFISLRAPPGRIGEMVGTLGSSGFIGMALGPVLGDWLFAGTETATAAIVQRMFLCAALAATASVVLTYAATLGSTPIRPKARPPMLWLIRRYHPGAVLFCAAAMGIGMVLPQAFLRPYMKELDIPRIRTFFFVYAAVAFSVRILTRRFTDRFGVRVTAQLGFACLTLGMISYTLVINEWLLALPAALSGLAHAFLFPAIITGGSVSFPARYRGLATTLVLAMFDVANLIGQPTIGAVVEYAPAVGLPGFTTMFLAVAGVMVAAGLAAFWIRLPAKEAKVIPLDAVEKSSVPPSEAEFREAS